MTLAFTDADIPAPTREANPFDGVFPRDDKAITLAPMPGTKDDKDPDGQAIRVIVKRASTAANDVDRSLRVRYDVQTVKGKATTTLTMWTVARITRKRGEDVDSGDATSAG